MHSSRKTKNDKPPVCGILFFMHWTNNDLFDIQAEIDGIIYKERWITIDGYKGYSISSFGRVKTNGSRYNGNKIQILKLRRDKDGYVIVNLYNNTEMRTKKVHRIVGTHFCPNNENKPLINHKDGDKSNNFYKNLEWNTISENTLHGFRVLKRIHPKGGTGRKGKLNGSSKAICCPTLGISFESITEAVDKLGVCRQSLDMVLKNKKRHTQGLYFIYKQTK